MGQVNYLIAFVLYTVLPLALTGVFVWAFLDALLRPERQFALADKPKNFWLAVLGLGGLAYFTIRVLGFAFPLSGLVTLGLLIAAVFYLGPERAKMGRRWGGDSRGTRGGW
ncbi:DUF2516 family protein [Trueperella pecoris]|uniref:DUF2516 family protein n=1 Tax=Trueperella pecoris TaxID=2733571 RepID=A0A7M1QVM3_9ACTO|nr:DUF2516 family protein [Trueperella pecoris]QOR45926.1 DUF2516 family protein [Trueperella pecoris]